MQEPEAASRGIFYAEKISKNTRAAAGEQGSAGRRDEPAGAVGAGRQREQAEKGRQRPRRSLDREGNDD